MKNFFLIAILLISNAADAGALKTTDNQSLELQCANNNCSEFSIIYNNSEVIYEGISIRQTKRDTCSEIRKDEAIESLRNTGVYAVIGTFGLLAMYLHGEFGEPSKLKANCVIAAGATIDLVKLVSVPAVGLTIYGYNLVKNHETKQVVKHLLNPSSNDSVQIESNQLNNIVVAIRSSKN